MTQNTLENERRYTSFYVIGLWKVWSKLDLLKDKLVWFWSIVIHFKWNLNQWKSQFTLAMYTTEGIGWIHPSFVVKRFKSERNFNVFFCKVLLSFEKLKLFCLRSEHLAVVFGMVWAYMGIMLVRCQCAVWSMRRSMGV